MYSRPHDRSIQRITTRSNHRFYGMGLGIMVLDDIFPGFPGDVRNASAWGFPIQYDLVRNIDVKMLVFDEDKSPCLPPMLEAAKRLEEMGCRAICGECGYFAWFQEELAGSVSVPIFSTSLLQVPFIQKTIGPKNDVGIVCFRSKCLTDEHLRRVGVEPGSNYKIIGADDDCPEFDRLWDYDRRPEIPYADYEASERDMIKVCRRFVKENPSIRSIMLECTGMQPFARAVQRELDLPVYSWGTLLDFAWSVVAHRDYYGHV